VIDHNPSQKLRSGKWLRVGLISTHPAPYCDPTFNRVHKRGIIDLEVLTLFERDQSDHAWELAPPEYPNTFLGKGYRLRRQTYYHPNIVPLLRNGHFDVIVIPGYNHVTCQTAFLHALKTGTAVVFTADAVLYPSRGTIVQYGKTRLRRAILKRSAAAWVPGKAATECMLHSRMPVNRIFEGSYTLDVEAISTQLAQATYLRQEYRRRLGIGDTSVAFLMVANLIPKRQHNVLISAFSNVEAACPECFLILIGSGPEKERLQQLCGRLGCNNIRFVDQVSFRQLAGWYVSSDAYVHSGAEAYSTAVTYAAIAGRAVISTPAVGATRDYVKHEITGYLVDSNDVANFASRMLDLAGHSELRQSMGIQIREVARCRTTDWAAHQLESAVESAYNTSARKRQTS